MVNCIVMTRFNLAIRFACKRRDTEIPVGSDTPWLDEEYLKKRFDIFEKYTLPSLLTQTDMNFKWIVMFHKDTPEVFKEKIRQFTYMMPQMEALFLNDEESKRHKDIIRDYIKQNYNGKDIITARIDNDDAIHKTFVEESKRNVANKKEASVLTYINGYQYDCRNNTIINYDYANNHFLVLYIPYGVPMEHILMFDHTQIDSVIKEKGFRKIEKRTEIPMWVEIINQTNLTNLLRWKTNSFFVPYNIKHDYPTIEVKWNSKLQWIIYVFSGTCKTPIYRIKNIIKVIRKK